MQTILHSRGYTVQSDGVVLHVDAGELPPDQVAAQLEQLGLVASELVPLLSALEGGVDADELLEVAGELPALQAVPGPIRQAVLELATQLRAAAADGQVTRMEVVGALLAAGRHAIGF
ncbi:MAG: hypothetical protein AMXMBFR33_01310 [Candidatus Xenobia bacterium]